MATKKQTISDRKDHLTHQLCNIRAVVALCGFAAEARRTLHEIDLATEIDPGVGKTLSRLVDARSEWMAHDDSLGLVLKEVDFQLGAVIELAQDLED